MSKLIPGDGTCKVSMINTGWLIPTLLSRWIATSSTQQVRMPVMAFLIERDGRCYLWDLGLPRDLSAINDTVRRGFGTSSPDIIAPLPESLTADQQSRLAGVFLSHYHWDHAGDIRTVAPHIPFQLGRGSCQAIRSGRTGEFNVFIASLEEDVVSRLSDVGGETVRAEPFDEEGNDIFGDGSFVIVPAPGHCPGHSIAIARVASNPDAYIVLGGDSGHNKALYAPCPCHQSTANLSSQVRMHYDEEAARTTLSHLTALSAREDTWVILAHEYEAIGIVPERQSLHDWRNQGWKRAVMARMGQERLRECYAREL